jgi:hypothetical protein
MLAGSVMVSRRFGETMFPDLAFERRGFCVRFFHHARKRPRQHAGLAARIDRNSNWIAAADPLDRRRQLIDRPGQRIRNQRSQGSRAQHRDHSDQYRIALDRGRRRHEDGVRHQLDNRGPFLAGQNHRRDGGSSPPSSLVRHDLCRPFRSAKQRRKIREIALPVRRHSELRAEFARGIGMNEIVALSADDIYPFARPHR